MTFRHRPDLDVHTDLPMVLEAGPKAALNELATLYPGYSGLITSDIDEAELPEELAAMKGRETSDAEFSAAVGSWLKRALWVWPGLEVTGAVARVSGSGRGIHVGLRAQYRDGAMTRTLTGEEVMLVRQLLRDDKKRWNLDLDRARQNVHYLGGNLWNRKGPNQEEQRGNRKVHATKEAGPWIPVGYRCATYPESNGAISGISLFHVGAGGVTRPTPSTIADFTTARANFPGFSKP